MKRLLAPAAFALLAISPIFSGDPPCQAPQGGCDMCFFWGGEPYCQCLPDCDSVCVGSDLASKCACLFLACIYSEGVGLEDQCVDAYMDCIEGLPPPDPPPHGCEEECEDPQSDAQCVACCECALGPKPPDPNSQEYADWQADKVVCVAQCVRELLD